MSTETSQYDMVTKALSLALDENFTLAAKNRALAAALQKYGRHTTTDCDASCGKCACGLLVALSQATA